MDRLLSRSLKTDADKPCSKCGMSKEDSKGCCKDEQKQVKLESDQKATKAFSLPVSFSSAVELIAFQQYESEFYITCCIKLPDANAPPDKGSITLYLRNNVFRI
jgi:hypothetical protein